MASPCQPLVVVDGVAWRNGGNLDDLPPQIVQTIEVYRGGSTAPMKLGFDTACGAIVITTRTGR
jgi:outer membrane cobalamin receptor